MTKKAQTKRVIYVKDPDRSMTGFARYEDAADALERSGLIEDESTRIKIRLRSRTDTFDVIVKVRREEEVLELTTREALVGATNGAG